MPHDEQRLTPRSTLPSTRSSTLPRAPLAQGPAPLFEGGGLSSGRDLAEFVFRHLRLLVGVAGGVTALAALLLYFLPQTYPSSALILVERSKDPTLRSDTINYPMESDEVINSEIEIVLSRAVAEGAVERLALDLRPIPDTISRRIKDWVDDTLDAYGLVVKPPRRERLIHGIMQTLVVKQAARSDTFSLTYYANDPDSSAEIARAVTDVYLDLHRRIYSANTAEFFTDRVKETEHALDDLRAAISRETSRPRLDALELRLKAFEASYIFFRDKLDRAKADESGDTTLVNARVVDYPVVPVRPWLSRLLLIFLAFVAGTVLAVCAALVRDYFDHAVYSPDDMTPHIDVPVLGSVRRVRGGTLRKVVGRAA